MNQVFTHPGQPQMQVEVILASRHAELPEEKPLFTIRTRYPRPIHGEIMTHRMFGRNARSSRAVPVRTMLNEVRETPYVPWHWGKNQKGMQASEECNELLFLHEDVDHWTNRQDSWLKARDVCADIAEAFMVAGYHKQNPNRLLEPFSWIDTLITANEWENFLWLRDHKDAEPHLQDLAHLVKQAIGAATVYARKPNDWHVPYITNDDRRHAVNEMGLEVNSDLYWKWLCKISAARCARISYKPFDGDASYQRELDRHNQLVQSDRVHASPLEHQATPDSFSEKYGSWDEPHFHGNLTGWIQNRKLAPNECHIS